MRYSQIRFTKMRSKPSVLEASILGNFLTLATDSIKDVTLLFPTLKIQSNRSKRPTMHVCIETIV